MRDIVITDKDDIVMRLTHYFITEENYTPIVVNGVKNEVWLENQSGPYRIIRMSSNYIHNNEQLDFDLFKTRSVMKQIKKKTLSFKVNTLNILLDVNDGVVLEDEKNINSVVVHTLEEVKKKAILTDTFPGLKNNLLEDLDGIDLVVNVSEDINKKTEKENAKFERVFKPKKEIVTYSLICINCIVFLLTYILGKGSNDLETLFTFGANYSAAVKNGEVYRLLTSIFLHSGIIHLLVNMYSLKVIGGQIETYLGKWRYLLIYLVSGITGSLLSCVFSSSLSVGASGAIFGLLGCFIYFGYHYRLFFSSVIKNQLIPIVLVNLLIGFILPGIDNAAHIGGLIGGYFITKAVGIKDKTTVKDQITGIIVTILYVLILCYFVFAY